MLLSEYHSRDTHTPGFGMNLGKEKATEVKAQYQRGKVLVIPFLKEQWSKTLRPSAYLLIATV